MPTSLGRSVFRRRARGSAYVAIAALVVTLVPALALTGAEAAPKAAPKAAAERARDALWTKTSERVKRSSDGHRRRVNPTSYKAFTLNTRALDAILDKAPDEASRAKPATLRIPAPNGKLIAFEIVESPVMEEGLAAQYPQIRTFAGTAVGSAASIRLDLTPAGFHASVRGGGAAWYVDPAYQNDGSLYVSYMRGDLPEPRSRFEDQPQVEEAVETEIERIGEGPGNPARQRDYRLALMTDPSYAEYFAKGLNDDPAENAQSNLLVNAEKVTLVNRMNQIYGDDIGMNLILVNDLDKLNLNSMAEATGANGPCGVDPCYTVAQLDPAAPATNGCTGGILTRNRFAIGQLIGAENYDVGHIALGLNGGGVASSGAGQDGKARGCTGVPTPTGDYFGVDYVAHEMGHQFAGGHTFNGNQVNCAGGNRSAAASVEPGSGSSVMSYAGICGQDNLQPHSDPYFSQRTQTEFGAYINSTPANVNEVQSVAFNGGSTETAFDGTDSFTLTFPGVGTTTPLTNGTTYNTAGLKAAVEAVFNTGGFPGTVVTPMGHFGAAAPNAAGFELRYGGTAAGVDVPNPTLNPTGFTGYHNTIAAGGAPTNGGFGTGTPGNRNPTVTAPDDKSIPIRTPFALTGAGSDPDGDDLIYLWEQNDRGGSSGAPLTSNNKVNGPLFRIFGKYADVSTAESLQYYSPDENLATDSTTRVFPDMDQILADNTNAETGTCPAPPAPNPPPAPQSPSNVPVPIIECYSEFLPTSAYNGDAAAPNNEPSLNFRLTARDMQGPNGGTDFGDTKLLLDKTAGPFLVTSQATATHWQPGSTQTITWDRANTHKPTLAPNVRILLSTDGGQTFGTVLAASTPNDGAQNITVPNTNVTQGRIMIEAVDNYFFDVADGVVTVSNNLPPETTITSGPAHKSYVLSSVTTFGFASSAAGSTFTCRLDGAVTPCSGSSVTLNNMSPGSHTFTVAAKDPSGNTDPTPARRTIGVPYDDRAMKIERGKWKRKTKTTSYLGTLTQVKGRAGAALSFQVPAATELAVLVNKGRKARKFGRINVLFNGDKIATIRLRGARRGPVIVPVASFPTPTSGLLTLVTHNRRKVRVDGVGVISAP